MSEGIWVESGRQKNVRVYLHWWKNKWKTELPPKGYVWIVHGMGEHGGRYAELATFLTGLGFDVLAPDLPGYGKTRREGGAPKPWPIPAAREQLQDLLEYWNLRGPFAAKGVSKVPWFLIGHSLGALTCLDWILAGKPSEKSVDFAKRVFISAPPLKLRMAVPVWKETLANVVGGMLPDLEVPTGMAPGELSRDAANGAAYERDPDVHGTTTPRVFLSMNAAAANVIAKPHDVEIPICLAVGTDDPVVDPAAVKDYFTSLGTHKLYLEFPSNKHEIFNELGRARCFEAVASWFL